MASRIVLNTISYHGHGAIENIVPELTARGYKKAFVCSDPDLIKFGVTKKVTDLLDAAGLLPTAFTARSSPIPHHPELFRTALQPFKAAEADCIVTIGGGLPSDWIPPRPSASSSNTPSSRTSAAWRALPPPRSTPCSPLRCPPPPAPLPRSRSTTSSPMSRRSASSSAWTPTTSPRSPLSIPI